MPGRTFSSPLSNRVADAMASIMILTRGKLATGLPFWAYLCIHPKMVRPLLDAQVQGNFQLEDYGTLLEWGEGSDPPEEIQKRMQRDFGMANDYEQRLMKALELLG